MIRKAILLSLALFVPYGKAATLPELFKQVKEELARGDYKQSLADVDLFDAESRKSGLEAERAKLVPVILFYRGANLAALGRRDEAKEAFTSYLSFMPSASIATPPFGKEVVEVFDAARAEAARKNNGMEAAFARFVLPAGWMLPGDAAWAEPPVRYILTAQQKTQYAALATPAEREAFVANFWKTYDPAFRAEFERRIAFADAQFGTAKTAGRATERGALFVFLGPPTYIAVAPLRSSDDAMEKLRQRGNRDVRSGVSQVPLPSLQTPPFQAPTPDLQSPLDDTSRAVRNAGRSNAQPSLTDASYRESWIYRRHSRDLRFDFIAGVMQKDPEPVLMLAQAMEAAQGEKKLK